MVRHDLGAKGGKLLLVRDLTFEQRGDVWAPASSDLFGSQQATASAALAAGAHHKPAAPSSSTVGSPTASPSATSSPVTLQARTANKNICAG